ncbi:UNVERIFIED_CONTAM: hypothetical protein B566_EDAN017425, partial [Ephemera danica]
MKQGYGWNADEMGSYMEGDILMPRRRGPVKRQIPTFRWPGGIVYYRINGYFIPIHEFMHVLGIFHEHVRADRDDYVKIGWRNIEHGKEHNFERRSYSGLGEVYDYTSVMHYSSRLDTERLIGQRNGFSDSDIAKVNRLYDCYNGKLSSLNTNNLFSNELSIPDYSDFSKFVSTPLFPQDDVSTEDEELESIRETIKKKKKKKPWRPPGGYEHEEYRPRKPPRPAPKKRPYSC